jgi:bifunctional non-homologous end joining protein LigD
MANVVRSIQLFFQEGTSDKVYNAAIVEEGGRYTLEVEWGRRGVALSKGKKAVKTSLAECQKAFDKVVREKTTKGYQEITEEVAPAAVAPPVGQGSGSRASTGGRARLGQAAQLLTEVKADRVAALLEDDDYVAQQKLDGVRLLVHVADEVIGTNRDGQVKAIPDALAGAVSGAPAGTILDGEWVGDDYWLFDLLQEGDDDLRSVGYLERHHRLSALATGWSPPVRVLAIARGTSEKRTLFTRLEAEHEGVVLKRIDAPYRPGRQSDGGQLKHKFLKRCDVFITANVGNAYQMAVYEGKKVRPIGKVFSGTDNQSRALLDEMIAAGERPVAEVQYLYATDDDVLFQARICRLRDDKRPEDCVLSQLKHTRRTVEDR